MLARSSARLTFNATCSVSIVRVQPGFGTATPLGVTETARDRRVGSHERTILRSIFVAIIIIATFQKEEEEGVLMRANRKPLRLSKEMLIQSKPLRSRSFSLHPIQALRTPPSLIKLATIHLIPTRLTLLFQTNSREFLEIYTRNNQQYILRGSTSCCDSRHASVRYSNLVDRDQGTNTIPVCREDLPIKMYKSRTFTSTCTHEANTCNTCLNSWLNESLTSKGWDKVTCPECGAPFQHDDVKSCTTGPLFERYDELATRATVSAIPNFRWCLSPRCRSGQIHNSDSPIFVCVACGFRHCIGHEKPWHEGETCQEYESRKTERKNPDEEQTQRTIERTTKKCPGKGCGVNIEKNDGCDHMTCETLASFLLS